MSIKVNWSFNATVQGGPKLSIVDKPALTVGAYDLVTATIDAGAAGVNVDLQPSNTAGDVVLLVITSDTYDSTITYSAGGGAITLDGPHLLVGAGAVGLLGATPPVALSFDNPLADPIAVQVLVGRK